MAPLVLAAGCMVQPPEALPRRGSGTGGPPEPDLAMGSPWTGWDDACTPATAFRRLAGWTAVTAPAGGTCRIERAAVPFSAGQTVARIRALSAGPVESVTLHPPVPVVIAEPFDSLELRIGCRVAEGTPGDVGSVAARVGVCIEDSAGAVLRVPLGDFARARWTIAHARIPAEFARTAAPPFRATSFEIRDWNSPGADELYLAGFSAYLQQGVPVVPAWRSPDWRATWEPPLRRVIRAASAPAGTDPVASPAASSGFRTEVRETAPGRYDLVSSDDSGTTTYAVVTADWMRGGEISWNGRPCGRWSGWEIESAGFDAAPRLSAIVGNRIRIETAGGLSVAFELDGRTLCVGMSGGARAIRAIRSGQVHPTSPLSRLRLPMLEGPGLMMWRCSDPVGTPVFATAFFDPAQSGASRIEFGTSAGPDRPGAAVYEPATDGRCAHVREVFRLALSARVGDVLPPVAPARGPRASESAVASWMEVAAMGTGRLRELWDDAGAGPLIFLPPPGQGGAVDEDSLDCLDPRWSRDLIRQSPDGGWVLGSAPGRFALKTTFLPMLAAEEPATAPEVARLAFRPAAAGHPPWQFTDFDARTQGAASFRSAWDGLCDWMRVESLRREAPVVAGSGWAWMHAASADAYAVDGADDPAAQTDGWLPIYPHLRLNAVMCGIGPAWRAGGVDTGEADRRQLAASFAYGLAPRFPALEAKDARLWRLVFLSSALHRRQTLRGVERMAYSDGRMLMSASDALSSGLWRRSMLYLRYPDGLEVWVNGSDAPWEIRIGAGLVNLPPAGWYASGPDFSCGSVQREGCRFEYVRSPEYIYHDGGGSELPEADLGCAGAVIVRTSSTDRGRTLDFRFPGAAARIGLGLGLLPAGSRIVRISAKGADGASVEAPGLVPGEGRSWVVPRPGTRRMELEWTN